MIYTAQVIQSQIEHAIKETRASTLVNERARVTRAILLFANTNHDEHVSAALLELLPFLYDLRDLEIGLTQ
jgi:hypothetical protein